MRNQVFLFSNSSTHPRSTPNNSIPLSTFFYQYKIHLFQIITTLPPFNPLFLYLSNSYQHPSTPLLKSNQNQTTPTDPNINPTIFHLLTCQLTHSLINQPHTQSPPHKSFKHAPGRQWWLAERYILRSLGHMGTVTFSNIPSGSLTRHEGRPEPVSHSSMYYLFIHKSTPHQAFISFSVFLQYFRPYLHNTIQSSIHLSSGCYFSLHFHMASWLHQPINYMIQSFNLLSNYPSIQQTNPLTILLFIAPSFYPSIQLSIRHLLIHSPVHLSIQPSILPSTFHASIHPSILPSTPPSSHPPLHPSIHYLNSGDVLG